MREIIGFIRAAEWSSTNLKDRKSSIMTKDESFHISNAVAATVPKENDPSEAQLTISDDAFDIDLELKMKELELERRVVLDHAWEAAEANYHRRVAKMKMELQQEHEVKLMAMMDESQSDRVLSREKMDALKTTFAEISLVNDEIEQTDAKSVAIEEEIRHLQSLKDQNQDFVNLQSLLNTDGDLERFNATKNALFEHLSANPTQFNWNEGREANEEAACAEEGEAETADH